MTSTTARRRTVHHRPHPTHPPPGQPLRAVLDLGAVPTAPGCARAWTQVILREWRLAALSDASELIVSELTTSGVLASRREGPRRTGTGYTSGYDDGIADRLASEGIGVLSRDDRAVLTMVLLLSVAIPRAEGKLPPEAQWNRGHPVPRERLYDGRSPTAS